MYIFFFCPLKDTYTATERKHLVPQLINGTFQTFHTMRWNYFWSCIIIFMQLRYHINDVVFFHFKASWKRICFEIKIRRQKEFHPKLQNFCWPLTVCNVNPLQSYFDRQEMELFCEKKSVIMYSYCAHGFSIIVPSWTVKMSSFWKRIPQISWPCHCIYISGAFFVRNVLNLASKS